MKKGLIVVLSLLMVMAFTFGTLAAEEASWEDGEYVGYVEKDRGDEIIKVEIKRGMITDVDVLNRFKLNYDYDKGREAFLKYPHLVESNQSTEFDIISGATGSFEDYNKATNMALKISSNNYEGNKYYGVAENFGHGHVVIEITVEGDKIREARLITGNPEDESSMIMAAKPDDYACEPALKYFNEFADKVVENQGNVDIVSGATHSGESYNEALDMAIDQAGL
jgi:uncharacterized protein with FMN-binding domain